MPVLPNIIPTQNVLDGKTPNSSNWLKALKALQQMSFKPVNPSRLTESPAKEAWAGERREN